MRIRPTPGSALAADATGQAWFKWGNDASVLDESWPVRGIFATACSCQVRLSGLLAWYPSRFLPDSYPSPSRRQPLIIAYQAQERCVRAHHAAIISRAWCLPIR